MLTNPSSTLQRVIYSPFFYWGKSAVFADLQRDIVDGGMKAWVIHMRVREYVSYSSRTVNKNAMPQSKLRRADFILFSSRRTFSTFQGREYTATGREAWL